MKITEENKKELFVEFCDMTANDELCLSKDAFKKAIDKALTLYGVSISNRTELNYLKSKYEVKWLINDVYQVEQDGNCIYQDTETGCNEYLKGLLGY